jgi:hypothetical protein
MFVSYAMVSSEWGLGWRSRPKIIPSYAMVSSEWRLGWRSRPKIIPSYSALAAQPQAPNKKEKIGPYANFVPARVHKNDIHFSDDHSIARCVVAHNCGLHLMISTV